jgi:hypothetical protein
MRRCSTSGVARMNIAIGKKKRVARGYNFSKCKGIFVANKRMFCKGQKEENCRLGTSLLDFKVIMY